MAEPIREPGFQGRLYSLGGIVGEPGQGRQGIRNSYTLGAGVGQIGLTANPRRIAATIQNTDTGDDLYAFFGNDSTGPAYLIASGDMLQIDWNLPWTGTVYLYSAGAITVTCNEVTIQT
jgi:hypothetical protein